MKITAVETIPIKLPTRRVHQWSSLTTPIGVYVIVKILTDDGLTGYGESPALKDWGGDYMKYYGETPETTVHVVKDILAPAISGRDPCAIGFLHGVMDKAVKGYPYAKASVDMALYDLAGKALGVPAYCLLGGCYRRKIPVAHSIGLMEIDKAVDEAKQVKSEGIKTVKLKGGQLPERDVDLVRRIREAVGADTLITVDANQGYDSPKTAINAIRAMEEYGIHFIEQPVEGVDAMAQVASSVDTPIMADESAWTPQDVRELARKEAADIISLYTTKPGGLYKAKIVAAVAEAYGLRCNVNGSVETGVGNAANLHLAVSTAVASLACVVPVSTPAGKAKGIAGVYYTDDLIVEPFEYDDGCVVVSDKPGLGIEVDESKLKHYRIE
jgi:muconate cycloisomerase